MEERIIQNSKCRLCLKSSERMKSLFTSELNYSLIVEEFTGLKLEYVTELPSLVCLDCIGLINILLDFRETCRKTQEILNSQINVKVEIQSAADESVSDNQSKDVNRNNHEEFTNLNQIKNNTEGDSNLSTSVEKLYSENKSWRKYARSYDISCHICGKLYSKFYMEYHLNRHFDRRPFKCKIEGCDKTFASPGQLREHLTYHKDDALFKCEICGRHYKTKAILKFHKTKHDEPKFPCNLCEKLFRNRKALKRHMFNHSGERPFKCDDCLECFKDQWSLKVHLRKAHGKEEPIICSLCGMVFGYNAALKKHMKKNHPTDDTG